MRSVESIRQSNIRPSKPPKDRSPKAQRWFHYELARDVEKGASLNNWFSAKAVNAEDGLGGETSSQASGGGILQLGIRISEFRGAGL